MATKSLDAALEIVNQSIPGLYKIAVVGWDDIEYLQKNARYMKSETFQQLIENIKSDEALSSVPLCWKVNGKYRVLSGNHRLKAAQSAGVERFLIMYTEADLTRSEEVARILSHNALVGQDDTAVLKSLWDEVANIEWKKYTGLDDEILKAIEKIGLFPLSEIRIDYRSLTILFFPEEVERLKEVLTNALAMCGSKEVIIARFIDYDRIMCSISEVQDSYHIKNLAASIMVMLDVFEEHLTDLQEGWVDTDSNRHDGFVPLSTIFGIDRVPSASAVVIKQAVDKMCGEGILNNKNLWQAIEYWAAEYLAGA